MIDPILSGIPCEGKVRYGVSIDFVIELNEDAEACMCKERMCRFGENVIT